MGYETRFHLELDGEEKDIDDIKEYYNYRCKNDPYQYFMQCLLKYSEHQGKYYDHEQELISLSINYPNIRFNLYGIGENWGDFWLKIFKDGNMQRYDCELWNITITETQQ